MLSGVCCVFLVTPNRHIVRSLRPPSRGDTVHSRGCICALLLEPTDTDSIYNPRPPRTRGGIVLVLSGTFVFSYSTQHHLLQLQLPPFHVCFFFFSYVRQIMMSSRVGLCFRTSIQPRRFHLQLPPCHACDFVIPLPERPGTPLLPLLPP